MKERLKRKLLYSRQNRRLIGWARRIILPGFEGFSLYEISRFFFRALFQGRITTRASAIAFKVFLAFFPAVLVLLTMIPYIPIPDFQQKLLVTFHDMLPGEVYQFIESTLHDLLIRKHGALLSLMAAWAQKFGPEDCFVGLKETVQVNYSVFPNPGEDQFSFTINGSLPSALLTLFDANGRAMGNSQLKNNKVDMDTSDLPPGLYTFRLIDGASGQHIASGRWIKAP